MRRRRLGQHILADRTILHSIVEAAEIQRSETVFEIGTGTGILTEKLCEKSDNVVSVEIDQGLYLQAKARLSNREGLRLVNRDAFTVPIDFDVLTSNLPYSESAHFVEWLAERKFRRAVVMLQKDFTEKLLTETGQKNYRAVSALAQAAFYIKKIVDVPRSAFNPQPKVASSLVLFEPKVEKAISREVQIWVKKLFSFRGRVLLSAIRRISRRKKDSFSKLLTKFSSELLRKRVETLSPSEALSVAQELYASLDHR